LILSPEVNLVMAMVMIEEPLPSPEVVRLYENAWAAISNEAREKLLALGVVASSDLSAVRDSGLRGGILFREKEMDPDVRTAYFEFQEAMIEEVRHSVGLVPSYRNKKAVPIRSQKA
jgi:hypothetical protein